MMSEKRFKSTIDKETMSIMPYLVYDNEEEAFYNLQGCVDLLNEQQARIKELENEKVELMEDCACQYRQIQKLESENDDLRTTITKQVEAITEMKDLLYMFADFRIFDYSSEIEEDMQELKKAYDGTLEDFLNYFKED